MHLLVGSHFNLVLLIRSLVVESCCDWKSDGLVLFSSESLVFRSYFRQKVWYFGLVFVRKSGMLIMVNFGVSWKISLDLGKMHSSTLIMHLEI